MSIVRIFVPENRPSRLTPEQIAEIKAAAKRPIAYDDDCPKLTPEQLAKFAPVNQQRRAALTA